MTSYRFTTTFALTAAPREVFDAVQEPEWLAGFSHVRRLEQRSPAGADGLGLTYDVTVGTVPYRLRWTMRTVAAIPAIHVAWAASGDLTGEGSWTLASVDAGVHVTSRWHVVAGPRWMRLLAPVAGPLFVWNHDRVMAAGTRRLADHLDAAVLSFDAVREP